MTPDELAELARLIDKNVAVESRMTRLYDPLENFRHNGHPLAQPHIGSAQDGQRLELSLLVPRAWDKEGLDKLESLLVSMLPVLVARKRGIFAERLVHARLHVQCRKLRIPPDVDFYALPSANSCRISVEHGGRPGLPDGSSFRAAIEFLAREWPYW